jgi:DNA topoisomerase-1
MANSRQLKPCPSSGGPSSKTNGDRPIHLRPHQLRVSKALQTQHGLLAIHSTGTGKSITAAAAGACLHANKIIDKVIVIAKKSALDQLESELHNFWGNRAAPELACVTHVTLLQNISSYLKKSELSRTLLVIDEAHEFVNGDASSTKKLLILSSQVSRVLLLTATPIINNTHDVAVLVAMARGNRKPPSLKEFEKTIAQSPQAMRDYFGGYVDIYMIDKNKDAHYPTINFHRVSIPMSKQTLRVYKKSPAAPFDINLRQLTLGTGDHNQCEKCEWIMNHIKKWIDSGEGKIVMYTSFIGAGVIKLMSMLKEAGVNTLLLDGHTSSSQRRSTALLFNRSDADIQEGKRDLRQLVLNNNTRSGEGAPRCGTGGVMMTRSKPNRPWVDGNTHKPISPQTSEDVLEDLPPVPPGWVEVDVCKPGARAGLAWVAKDGKNHWQYRYTDDWSTQQEYKKIMRLKSLDTEFWHQFNKRVDRDMTSSERGSQLHMLSVATLLLQECHFRAGYKADSDHHGLMTLRAKHINNDSNTLRLEFIGKAGKLNVCHLPVKGKLGRELTFLKRLATKSSPNSSPSPPLFPKSVGGAKALRSHLNTLKPGLRPKDFRTYHANYVLMDHLKQKPYPQDMTIKERRARIATAINAASKDLNNTPGICKRSYVFTAFWVMYLVDPATFTKILTGNHKTTHDVVASFVDYYDKQNVDWQHMLQQFNESRGVADFLGSANVLLITDAGAESIDLKGVRHIVLIDPAWTPALEDQIIGRGQRYNSHAALPASKRNVNVWKLMLDLPRDEPSNSIERRMDDIVTKKRTEQAQFLDLLRKIT